MAKTAAKIGFTARLLRPSEGGAWTFLRVPQEASDKLPTRSMASVEGTMNGFAFQATLQPDGMGGHWLKVEPSLSEGAGVSPGDMIELEISPVTVEPEPQVPDDLWDALSASPEAMGVWNATTAIARRDWIQWMTSGRKAETRAIRREKMMDMLAKGKRRVCCFDRSGQYSKEFSCPTAAMEESND